MLFLDSGYCARVGDMAAVRTAIAEGLARMHAAARGGGGKIWRALILDGAPDAASGELTDKGYINQALARSRRPVELTRLFAAEPDDGVLTF
jgi:feruloyl-CoA synthase